MEFKMNELAIPEASFNFEELKQEITARTQDYKNVVVTEDAIKDFKGDRAKLNKLKKALDDARKDVKKKYNEPYLEFEKKVKELIAIVDEPIAVIDGQLKEFENERINKKQQWIEEHFNSIERPDWLKLEQIEDKKWLNATVSENSIQAEILNIILKVKSDIDSLQNLPNFAFESIECYKSTLDVSKALNEAHRLSEMAKRKAEAERKALELKKQREEQEKVIKEQKKAAEEQTEEVKEEAKEEAKQWVSFKCLLTVSQARALGRFFKENNITFREDIKW